MKKLLLSILFIVAAFVSFAHHTKGGWMRYEYLGPGVNDPTKLQYRITLKVYMICTAVLGQQIDDPVNFTFFDGNNQFIENVSVPLLNSIDISNCITQQCNPCIANIPQLCYKIVTYETIKELAPSANGYTVSWQRCCRIDVLANVQSTGDNVGDTWTIKIPGTGTLQSAPQNSSPVFPTDDTTIVCAHNYFTYKFEAQDAEGDSLSYSFTTAYDGTPPPGPPAPATASNPPYTSVPYINPFTAFQPLGTGVVINPRTGLVSGIAPDVGEYVIAVLVTEYRGGIAFASSRKSLHIQVADCSPVKAILPAQYSACDGFTQSFFNIADNPSIQTWHWDFGVASQTNDTSNLQRPTFTYPDTGTYILKLVVNRGLPCADSTVSPVRVYPGFFPGFTTAGQCKNTPIQFNDTTKANYGIVNGWRWNFGDLTTLADTSILRGPTYTYPTTGNYDVQLIVSSSKGCIDTVVKTIMIKDRPALTLSNDTLICAVDTLQLNAIGSGSIFWSPNYNINNQTSFTPLVSPDVPTKYYATLTDPFGCVGRDSVFVNVVLQTLIDAGNDTSICKTDNIVLKPTSNGVNYLWTPSTYLSSDTAKNPTATPLVTTTYYVTARIGKCNATDSVTIKVTPYPNAFAGNDTAICIGQSVQLQASGGSIYSWSPAIFLDNPNIANPVSTPSQSIRYTVTVRDVLGCPKPVTDSVTVIVQKVFADAGPRDTGIVINQPLQLNATGGQFYLWTPSRGLNNTGISNPVAILDSSITYIVTASTSSGCFGTDTITVIVYQVDPGLYVPNAFTPNGDGLNDVFRPIPIGMKEITSFRVYNRWGQLMFSTSVKGFGWDGKFKGVPQDGAAYVWIVEGIDYLDRKITRKGTVILIR